MKLPPSAGCSTARVVARPEWAGGPEERSPVWWAAVVAAAVGTIPLLL